MICVGIDVAKDKHDCFILSPEGEVLANDIRPACESQVQIRQCRGCYVDTVGKNKKTIEEYIRNQLIEDEIMDQMTIKEYVDPFTGSKNSKA